MNVYLGPELDRFVGDLIKSGMYQSQSEVLRESLRLLKEREEMHRIRLDELRQKIAIGAAQAKAGKLRKGDGNTFDRIRTAATKRAKARARKAG